MNFSYPFIRRPIGTALLALGLFLAGAVAYGFLPVSSMPTIEFPTIRVSASRPGADPSIMAATVAAPLERRLGEIPGVTEITSTSSLGTTNITIQFDLDRSIDGAARDVQAALNAALTDLPGDLPTLAGHAQGQSVGVADPDPGADLQHHAGEQHVRCRRQRHRPAHRPRSRASPRSPSTAPSSRRCASASIRSPSPRWASAWRTSAPPSPTPIRRARSAPSTAPIWPAPSAPTISSAPSRDYQNLVVKIGQRHRGPAGRHRRCRAGRAQQPLGGLVQRPAVGAAGRHQAGRRQRHRHGRPHLRDAARAQALDSGRHPDLGAVRPHPDHPRQRPRHAAHAARHHRAGDAGGVPVPAPRRRDRSRPASRCRWRWPGPARRCGSPASRSTTSR